MSTGTLSERYRGRGSFEDRLSDLFYPLYELLFDENDAFVIDLSRKLAAARMSRPVGLYLSRALAYGVIAGAALWSIGIAVALAIVRSPIVADRRLTGLEVPNETLVAIIQVIRIPALVLTSGVVLGSIGFALVFGTFVALPYSRAAARRREIDRLLPDAVSFMYALSIGGMSEVEIIETMANTEDTYGEVSREFRTILLETSYFDTDYRSAIQALSAQTPSEPLSQFLTDMLSIIDSGGSMTDFLDDKKDVHFRKAKQQEEQTNEALELFTEMYITISLFPLLLIIILVIMSMIGGTQQLIMYLTVYVLIPILGLTFLVLISTVRQDEYGDGELQLETTERRFESGQTGPLNLGLVTQFTGSFYIFDRIERNEGTNETIALLRKPHLFLRDNPYYTLALTLPASLAIVAVAVLTGSVGTSWAATVRNPVWTTFVYAYLPLFLVCIPLTVFWEWNVRSRRAVLTDLGANLRKLASANATGLTLLESVKVVADTTPGKLGEEFDVIYAKSHYGMHLKESLIVFNNKFQIPRLARTVKLISKAQEISSEISSVLLTAARAAETQEDIERDRRGRARIQVAIILLVTLTLLGVMAVMKVQFIDALMEMTTQMGDRQAEAGRFGVSMNLDVMGVLFLHAMTLQAIFAGLACGYIQDAKITAGVKYVVALLAIVLGVWVVI